MLAVIALMIAYGLFHSVLASEEVKQAARRRVGVRVYEGFYRAFFNLVAILTFVPVSLLIVAEGSPVVWTLPESLSPMLTILQVIGIIGFVLSLVQIDFLRFAGLRQMFAYFTGGKLPLENEPLTTTGVFRLVRHPLYLFSLMLIWSVSTMTQAYLGFAIGASLYMVVGSIYEERRMVQAFGTEYVAYQDRVPWLIPFVRLPSADKS